MARMNLMPIVKKEFRQISRDKRTMGILIFIPALLLVMVGYALNFDVKHLRVAVLDENRTAASRELVESLTHSEYFDHAFTVERREEIDELIEAGRAHLAFVIPKTFSHEIVSKDGAMVQVIIDGANANSASIASSYIYAAFQDYSGRIQLQYAERMGRGVAAPIEMRQRMFYNPTLTTTKYLVPGLFGVILMIVTVVSTSLSVVREKEMGTMEQLKTSPLHAMEIILGKILPYLIIAVFASSLILLLGFLMFGVEVKGSILLLYFAITLFLVAGLGQGLLISTVADTQQLAFLMSVLSSMLPSVLLSGFIFPISSMPVALQYFSSILPVRYFLIIVRGIILKGVGVSALWVPFVTLTGLAALIVTASSIRLRRELMQ